MAHNNLSTQSCPHKAGLTGPETHCQKRERADAGKYDHVLISKRFCSCASDMSHSTHTEREGERERF